MYARKTCCAVLLLLLVFVEAGCGPKALLIEAVPGGRRLQETEIDRDEGVFVKDKIAVIDVDGVIAYSSSGGLLRGSLNQVSLFREKLDKARKDSDVKAVVLRLNSPGGTVGASDAMYHELVEFRKDSKKPVIACMLDVAASGAYYIACGCDGIMAQPSSITGSIGTIVHTVSFAGTMEKLGIKSATIKSGKLKDMGSPFHDLNEEEREVFQGLIIEFFDQFVKVVDQGRGGLREEQVRQLADGRVFTAREAKANGLIDRIGYPSDALAWAKEKAGIDKTRVVIYHRPAGYKPNIYSSSSYDGGGVGSLVNVEMPDWLTRQGTQFLYLWEPGIE